MQNEIDRRKLYQALDNASDKLGADGEKLKQSIAGGSMDGVLNALSPGDAAKLSKILSDKALTERLLSSPQAKQLFQMLIKDK